MISNRMLEAALLCPKGWHIFPVKPNAKAPLGRVVLRGHHEATVCEKTIRHWWTQTPNANIGLNLEASGFVCIDVDSYKTTCQFDNFIRGKALPETLTQRSASGGIHYIYKADASHEYPGALCVGVDVKHKGYILLHPSVFNNMEYEWQNSIEPQKAPNWLCKKITASKGLTIPSSWLPEMSIQDLLAVIHSEGWHNTLLRLVGSLVARGKSDECIHELTDQLTLPGYQVSETQQDIQRMIESARRKAFGSEISSLGANSTADKPEARVVSNHYNIYRMLQDDSPWAHVFSFDEFTGRKMVIAKPPGERGNPNHFRPRDIKDSDYTKVLKWLNQNGHPRVQKQLVVDCVQEICEENIISPVRHYLESLKFDPEVDKHQLSFWMEEFLGVRPRSAKETQYVEAVSRLS